MKKMMMKVMKAVMLTMALMAAMPIQPKAAIAPPKKEVQITPDGTEVETKTVRASSYSVQDVQLKTVAKKSYKKTVEPQVDTKEEAAEAGPVSVKKVTTTVTYKTETFTKGLKTKAVETVCNTTTVTTITRRPYIGEPPVASSGKQPYEVNAYLIAPYMSKDLLLAFKDLGFRVIVNPAQPYASKLDTYERVIYLKKENSSLLYKELGNFLSFLTDNRADSAEWKKAFKKEGRNISKNAKAYFAESVKDFALEPLKMKKSRPETFKQMCLAFRAAADENQVRHIKYLYGEIWGNY